MQLEWGNKKYIQNIGGETSWKTENDHLEVQEVAEIITLR